MDKQSLLNQLIDHLQDTLDTLEAAAESTRDAATNEESKAENKYDTRGLEASYLAGAQAKRVDELRGEITRLSSLDLQEFTEDTEIDSTALILVEIDSETQQHLFLLPTSGGNKVRSNDKEVQIITPSSPVGKRLLGQTVGGGFELKVGDHLKEYEIIQVT